MLLVRLGGPFWRNRDVGAWMIPKGGVDGGETIAEAALRELKEETGLSLQTDATHLCSIRQSSGKTVEVFVAEGDFDPSRLCSVEFEMEWPRRSGALHRFPEVEEARWMTIDQARRMMLPSQLPILDSLEKKLKP